MKPPLRIRLRVHLDTGRTFEGVLLDRKGAHWRMAHASVQVGGEMVPADGPVYLPAARVEWAQEVAS